MRALNRIFLLFLTGATIIWLLNGNYIEALLSIIAIEINLKGDKE